MCTFTVFILFTQLKIRQNKKQAKKLSGESETMQNESIVYRIVWKL